jgi:hypothetical protein
MPDETEGPRRILVHQVNSAVESSDEDKERKRLEELYGEVWDTDQVRELFEVEGFMAPFVVVKRKSDGKKGSLMFQHRPRFYFKFQEA